VQYNIVPLDASRNDYQRSMGNFSDVLHISYEVTVSIIHCKMQNFMSIIRKAVEVFNKI